MTLHFSHMGFTDGLTFIVKNLLNAFMAPRRRKPRIKGGSSSRSQLCRVAAFGRPLVARPQRESFFDDSVVNRYKFTWISK